MIRTFYFTILFVVVFVASCKHEKMPEYAELEVDNISYRTEVFQIDTGWGYKIYKNGKLYIEQRLIPAVNGHFLFETYEDAFQTGVFVMNRMSEQKGLPSVSIEELDSLGVLYQEVKEFQEIDFSTKKGNIPYNKDK